jgi:hypothetical protein
MLRMVPVLAVTLKVMKGLFASGISRLARNDGKHLLCPCSAAPPHHHRIAPAEFI